MREVAGWVARGVDAARDVLGGDWNASALHGTGGARHESGVVRLRSDRGSVVVKVVRRNEAPADDPVAWRRELDAYGSSWLVDRLPEGVDLPRCIAATTTDEAAVIVMEDVPFDDVGDRTAEWYGQLAQRLGTLSTRPVDDVPAWASRGVVAAECAAVAGSTQRLLDDPGDTLADLVASWRPVARRLVPALPELLARLDAAPAGFAHLDAFSRNAARVGDRFVLIDWAHSGVAPVGADAAGIVALTAMHGDVAGIGLDVLHDTVVSSFVDGVTGAGVGTVDVTALRARIDALLTLRWAVFLTRVHALGDDLPAIAEAVASRPIDDLLAAWSALSDLVEPIADRVLAR